MKQSAFKKSYKKLSDKILWERYCFRQDKNALFQLTERYIYLTLAASFSLTQNKEQAEGLARKAFQFLARQLPHETTFPSIPQLLPHLLGSLHHQQTTIELSDFSTQTYTRISTYHIPFFSFACLSKRQLLDAIRHRLVSSEQKNISKHAEKCPLCRMALQGAATGKPVLFDMLNTCNLDFLETYYRHHSPQIVLNGISPVLSTPPRHRIKSVSWVGISGGLLLIALLIGFLKFQKNYKPVSTETAVQESFIPIVSEVHPIAEKENEIISATYEANKEESQVQVQKEEKIIVYEERQTVLSDAPPAQEIVEVQEKSNSTIPEPSTTKMAITDAISATAALESGKYEEALSFYLPRMQSKNEDIRFDAMLMVAKCYIGLKQPEEAGKLLQNLIDEAKGAPKRKAKRLLRSLD